MSDKSWKRNEREAAAFFGAYRNRLSGSSGRDCDSKSDSTHARLYMEHKRAKRHALWSLMDDTAAKAKDEGKLPVIMLKEHGRRGWLVVMLSADFDTLAVERMVGSPAMRDKVSTILAEGE